jgi:hypothetical protein
MSYMLLVVEPPSQRAERTAEAGRQVYARMLRFAEDLKARGVLLGVESLASHAQGARVQMRAGRRSVVDGPFTEAKEFVGGFFLLDCATQEEAVTIASECPAAEWCTVEVRKVGPCWD